MNQENRNLGLENSSGTNSNFTMEPIVQKVQRADGVWFEFTLNLNDPTKELIIKKDDEIIFEGSAKEYDEKYKNGELSDVEPFVSDVTFDDIFADFFEPSSQGTEFEGSPGSCLMVCLMALVLFALVGAGVYIIINMLIH